MPFDFYHPLPPTPIVDRFDKKQRAKSRNWPVDRYDNNGGSFPIRPDAEDNYCGACPGKQYDDRNYTSNFLRDSLMYQTPVVLCSLKNTVTMKDVLREPEIQFVSPHFIHKAGRSTSHLRVPAKYRAAICKIHDNLKKDYKITKSYENRRLKVEQKARKPASLDFHSNTESISSKSSVSSDLLSRSSSGLFEAARPEHQDSLIAICKKGQLLNHVRKNVEEDIRQQELEEQEKNQYRFPSKSQLKFDIEQIRRNPDLYPKERYAYDPNSAMAMLCARKYLLSKFYESENEKKLAKPTKNPYAHDNDPLFRRNHLPQLKRRQFTPSMLELITKAPTRSFKGPIVTPQANDPFSHLGLIEKAKGEALTKFIGELDVRERNVTLPEELTKSMYGPVNNMPPWFKIDLPPILQTDYPAQQKELKKVEAAIKHDDGIEKRRRRQGLKSPTRTYGVIQRFTKSLMESDADYFEPQNPKNPVLSEDYYKERFNELHIQRSSDTLFCTVSQAVYEDKVKADSDPNHRKTLPWISQARTEIRERVLKMKQEEATKKKQDAKKLEKLKMTKEPKITLSTISALLIEDEDDYNQYLTAADSRETQQYSDIAYSDIDPPKNVPGLRHNTLYQALARETASSSDGDGWDEQSTESLKSAAEFLDLEDENEDILQGDSSAEMLIEDEIDNPGALTTKSIQEMFESKREEENVFPASDPIWEKLKAMEVETVPQQIKLKDPKVDHRDVHYPVLEIIYGEMSAKEKIRQNRLTDPSISPVLGTHNSVTDDEIDMLSTKSTNPARSTKTESHTSELPEAAASGNDSEQVSLPFEVTDDENSALSYPTEGESTATEIDTSQSLKSIPTVEVIKKASIMESSMSVEKH